MTIQELFDKILSLEEGQKMTISFPTRGELSSKRTMLIRERQKYIKKCSEMELEPENICLVQEVNTTTQTFKLIIAKSPVAWESTITVEEM